MYSFFAVSLNSAVLCQLRILRLLFYYHLAQFWFIIFTSYRLFSSTISLLPLQVESRCFSSSHMMYTPFLQIVFSFNNCFIIFIQHGFYFKTAGFQLFQHIFQQLLKCTHRFFHLFNIVFNTNITSDQ